VEAPLKILRDEPLHLLEHIHLNWTGREDLLIALLKKRFYPLACAILEDFVHDVFRERHLNVEIGPVSWWLDWIKNTRGQNRFWLANRLGHFFSVASKETQARLIGEFNSKNSPYRALLAAEILPKFPDLTTDNFDDDAISFLLADLAKREHSNNPFPHVLAVAGTESFVRQRLLPLLPSADEPLRANLIDVLKTAGRRHGRRYVDDAL
jgi:hypothetical protein